MRAISSLRDIKMRVLVLSALLACVAAAPSHLAAVPLAAIAVPTIAVAPTVPPGDIQAAAINAQVRAADQAQFIADQARELAEQAVENQNEGVVEANDLAKEKSEEAFWAAEEQKMQAVTNVQTAEAKIDASVASNADVIAKSLSPGVITAQLAPGLPYAGIIHPGAPIASLSSDAKPEAFFKSEAMMADEKNIEVKSADIEKPAEAVESEKKEEAVGEIKSAASEALNAENIALQNLRSAIIPAPIALAPGYNYQALVAPYSYQSAFNAYPYSTFQAFPGQIYPTLVKNIW